MFENSGGRERACVIANKEVEVLQKTLYSISIPSLGNSVILSLHTCLAWSTWAYSILVDLTLAKI